MTYRVVNPDSLEAPSGWNHGMLAPEDGRLLFVAGQTARDDSGRISAATVAGQWERALERVVAVVREAGGTAEDIGRLTIFVTDRAEYRANREAIGEAYRHVMGRHFPAMALVEVAGLLDDEACVEIQATAVLP